MRLSRASRAWAIGACLVTLGFASTACVESNRPDSTTCAAPSVEVELTLSVGVLTPSEPAACRDQRVTLRVRSEVDGVLHLHAFQSEMPGLDLREGRTTEASLVVTRSGQFPLELHPEGDAEGVVVGILTVHEP